MFDLGDDIILDNFTIPWLIWIQILVMFLLTFTILLFYFGLFALDSSSTSNSSEWKTSSSCNPSTQVAENHDARRETTTAPTNRVGCIGERDGSSMKDVASSSVAASFFHPCRYFDFAKEAFLKCLGLGSGSHKSPEEEHEHED